LKHKQEKNQMRHVANANQIKTLGNIYTSKETERDRERERERVRE